jgi:hypothetical protein
MNELQERYAIPPEIMAFVNDGFLEVLAEKPDEKTIEFHIPSRSYVDRHGNFTTFTVGWIHPDFNAEFCECYDEEPGDLPNFYVVEEVSDHGDEQICGMDPYDDLESWLTEQKEYADDE